jgi:hypothetical protein
MARYGVGIFAGIMAFMIGVVMPIVVISDMAHGLDAVAGVIIVIFALITGCIVAVVGMGMHFAAPYADNESASDEEEKLKLLRTSHRALLEEMDDELKVLKEIRDSLKGSGGGSP